MTKTYFESHIFRHLILLLRLFEFILTLTLQTQLFTNTPNISSNTSNIPTYNPVPPSTMPQSTNSHPTYLNSSASICEPIKPFDGFDHSYTPEEYD